MFRKELKNQPCCGVRKSQSRGLYLQERALGQRLNIIIIAEGAIDMEGKPITPNDIKDVSISSATTVTTNIPLKASVKLTPVFCSICHHFNFARNKFFQQM